MIYEWQAPCGPACRGDCRNRKHELPTITGPNSSTSTNTTTGGKDSLKKKVELQQHQDEKGPNDERLKGLTKKEESTKDHVSEQGLSNNLIVGKLEPQRAPTMPIRSDTFRKLTFSRRHHAVPICGSSTSASRPIVRTPQERQRLATERKDQVEMEQRYSHATWRMYHRITHHRTIHPPPACYYYHHQHHDNHDNDDANDRPPHHQDPHDNDTTTTTSRTDTESDPNDDLFGIEPLLEDYDDETALIQFEMEM